ncbi:DNA replication protein [Lactobacillus taiwanensis]|uniref:conserved phage C-terminal domain-containing protein n=1 Tax=Lactobacillus taiwanensis TaxID=508451 RepID=UPI000B98B31E|nr:conserved phage C-terminal domain-containing protein [Lactobacillus taiwanensis]OYS00302.1 DNA replication protein [Lactobacillus taiwanensis]OYS03743.1 DNA replication protein [Lactobacillus taiwanensis]
MGRRMFSDKVVETDKFLDMPVSTQNLYFHLCMHADDDGFLGNPKTITRSIGGQQDDLTHLIEKGYVIVFEDGTVAITDWFVHNYIPKDRYHKTVYQENKKKLELSETKQYRLVTRSPIVQDTESKQDVYNMDTDCIQDANKVYTEDKLSKDKLSKDNNTDKLSSSENVDSEPKQKSQKIPYEKIVDYLNRKTNSHYRPTSKATRRLIKARYNEGFTDIDFKTVIDKKCAEWLQDGNMVQYLRPETLFGTKFEAYLNQPDTGPIPRRNFGNKPVRRATNWDKVQQQQSQTVPQLTQEERNAIFREYGR